VSRPMFLAWSVLLFATAYRSSTNQH
jgi:hypothetical protein